MKKGNLVCCHVHTCFLFLRITFIRLRRRHNDDKETSLYFLVGILGRTQEICQQRIPRIVLLFTQVAILSEGDSAICLRRDFRFGSSVMP